MPLTQPQKEALVDLLVVGMYADHLLSLKENDTLQAVIAKLEWTPLLSPEIFLEQSFARARTAQEEPAQLSAYLYQKTAHFDTPETKQAALQELTDFLQTDGLDPGEAPFLTQVQTLLQANC